MPTGRNHLRRLDLPHAGGDDSRMSFESDGTVGELDDRRAFVAAASLMARLDEILVRTERIPPLYRAKAIRREAVAVGVIEGAVSRPESVARLEADPDATMIERGARLAVDIRKALSDSLGWISVQPDSGSVSRIFMLSDASSSRLIRPDMAWSLEEDCDFTAEEFAMVAETPEPWTAIEAIRRIWTSGRFLGHSRRMALLAAPCLIARGFDLRFPFLGLADEVRKNPDRFREVETNPERWSIEVARSLALAAGDGARRFSDIEGLRATLAALCPSERSSSSVGGAIDLLIRSPIVTARMISEELDLTPRGAKVILDKLADASIIEIEGGARNRRFVCRRAMS